MKTIVHITADYPDPFDANKTKAVLRLIDGTKSCHRHFVYSLNRVNGLRGVHLVDAQDNLVTLTYNALPFGIGFTHSLEPVAQWIIEDLVRRSIQPDCIHAHKLTVEGVIGRRVASHLQSPLICSLWGNTDQKILRYRPDLKREFLAVIAASSRLLPATPWIKSYVQRYADLPEELFALLPIVSDLDEMRFSPASKNGLVTVFNLDQYKNKNVERILQALRSLRETGLSPRLDIYGAGKPGSSQKISKMIAREGLGDQVRLRGVIPNEIVPQTINGYQGLILPSLRETFGMVYVEALFAGVPVLYTRGQAIDGFFDPHSIGYACNPRSVSDIVAGIRRIVEQEEWLKDTIRALAENGRLDLFRKEQILANYAEICEIAATPPRPVASHGSVAEPAGAAA